MSEKPTPDEVLDALQTARTYLGERRFEDGAVIGGSRVSYREIHDALAAAMRRAEEPTVERDDARGTAAAFIALTEELWPAVNEYERAHADPHRPDPARRSTATAQLRTVLSHLRSWAYDDDKLRATREAAEAEATALRERVAALGGGLSDAERHLFMASHAMHQAAAWIVAEAAVDRAGVAEMRRLHDARAELAGWMTEHGDRVLALARFGEAVLEHERADAAYRDIDLGLAGPTQPELFRLLEGQRQAAWWRGEKAANELAAARRKAEAAGEGSSAGPS